MSKKTKQFLLRLPEELHAWLKANVKDQTINDFIVSLITQRIKSGKVSESEEAITLELELPPKIKELLAIRDNLLHGRKHKPTFSLTVDVKNIKEKWSFFDVFTELETLYLDADSAVLAPDIMDALFEKVEEAREKYFNILEELSWDDRTLMYDEIRRRERWGRCAGDPEEKVYKDITRKDIFWTFSLDKRYKVNDVAGELGLTYMQAYMNVVPWMKKEGFVIE